MVEEASFLITIKLISLVALQCYQSGGTADSKAYYRNVVVMFFEEDL